MAKVRLDAIIAKVRSLGDGQLQARGLELVGASLERLAREGIEARRSPRGRAWRPFKSPSARMPGLAAAALREAITRTGMTLVIAMPSAKAQQRGAKHLPSNGGQRVTRDELRALTKAQTKTLTRDGWKLPARPMLPGGGTLPPAWAKAVTDDLHAAFGAIFK